MVRATQVGLSAGARCAARLPTSGSGEKTRTVVSCESSGDAARTLTCMNCAGHRGGLAIVGVTAQYVSTLISVPGLLGNAFSPKEAAEPQPRLAGDHSEDAGAALGAGEAATPGSLSSVSSREPFSTSPVRSASACAQMFIICSKVLSESPCQRRAAK